jgi:2'-5' RNA ligase
VRHDPRQLCLFGAPAAPPMRPREKARLLPHKFFFAIQPPADEATAISQLAATMALQHNGVPLRADNLHVSLNGVGAYATVPTDMVDCAVAAATEVNFAPFDVAFDRFLTWGRGQSRPTVLRCITGEPELQALHAALYTAMVRSGLPAKAAPGIPHITLFYSGAVLPEQYLSHPFAWRVDRFCLIHSIQGTGRHEPAGEWLLRGTRSTDPPSITGRLF